MGKQKQVSDTLLNKLTKFVVCELAEKVLDGVTSTVILKSPKYRELYKFNIYNHNRRGHGQAKTGK